MCARFVCQIIGSDVGSDVGSAVGQLWVNCGSAVGGSLLAHSAYRSATAHDMEEILNPLLCKASLAKLPLY